MNVNVGMWMTEEGAGAGRGGISCREEPHLVCDAQPWGVFGRVFLFRINRYRRIDHQMPRLFLEGTRPNVTVLQFSYL